MRGERIADALIVALGRARAEVMQRGETMTAEDAVTLFERELHPEALGI